jgi:hypothetical protein
MKEWMRRPCRVPFRASFYWGHQIERKMIAIRSFGGCFIFYRAGEMYLLSSREVLRVLNYRIIE